MPQQLSLLCEAKAGLRTTDALVFEAGRRHQGTGNSHCDMSVQITTSQWGYPDPDSDERGLLLDAEGHRSSRREVQRHRVSTQTTLTIVIITNTETSENSLMLSKLEQ